MEFVFFHWLLMMWQLIPAILKEIVWLISPCPSSSSVLPSLSPPSPTFLYFSLLFYSAGTAIWTNSPTQVYNSTFKHNTAPNAGGLFCFKKYYYPSFRKFFYLIWYNARAQTEPLKVGILSPAKFLQIEKCSIVFIIQIQKYIKYLIIYFSFD